MNYQSLKGHGGNLNLNSNLIFYFKFFYILFLNFKFKFKFILSEEVSLKMLYYSSYMAFQERKNDGDSKDE